MEKREGIKLPEVAEPRRELRGKHPNGPYNVAGGMTEAQREAVRMYVWETHMSRPEIAKIVGVDISTLHRWFRERQPVKDEIKRQLEAKQKDDDMYYFRLRRAAQETLGECLKSPYHRDRITAAQAILTRAGDTDAVRLIADSAGVVRGGAVPAAQNRAIEAPESEGYAAITDGKDGVNEAYGDNGDE